MLFCTVVGCVNRIERDPQLCVGLRRRPNCNAKVQASNN